LINSVKHHLLLHISQKKTTKEIYDSLTSLFETKNPSRKRALQSQLRDKMIAIDEAVDDEELVATTLNGLPSSWEQLIQVVSAREMQPPFERLWTNCIQEEGKILSRNDFPKE